MSHRIEVPLADGGPVVEAEVLAKTGLVATHPHESGKGYVLTHVATGRRILWARTRADAAGARRALEALDWGAATDSLEGAVAAIRTKFCRKRHKRSTRRITQKLPPRPDRLAAGT